MTLHGIKTLAGGNLDREIVDFLQNEGFERGPDGLEKYVETIDNYSAWTITVTYGLIVVSPRYGGDDRSFEFDGSNHASFVDAYNQMVDIVRGSE